MEAIIVEDRLEEIFNYLPPMANDDGIEFTPTFTCGTQKQLLDFLRQNKKTQPYPLIWLIYPYKEDHKRGKVHFENMPIVIAVETNSVMLNDQRMEETIKKYLMPLFSNIRKAFEDANIITVLDNNYSLMKFPNYSNDAGEGDANKSTAVWDAIKITISGYITDNCLRPIVF